ncbi:MAG: phosphohistidine phosphatase SixA [Armatimonadota bacterium]|nr:phosphohistidine phosphatase SixA [Armatimonadota bacterium]MDR7438704.1 phosphohistidine phosphatase SixA [Armatimonadota bacterium]MDR7563746.1 phosphohistidine phosphatase SixA [Armatimonadota bacterium]MDR7567324.1 phosphohistidine phosphatase SixA [Armatimonadota bacterium]MDR7602538.1 phosphohistidine phosphatase SixA [Armatimonadota bacterium]
MRLYLVQHAEAKPESEDPLRPLTEKGWRDAERVARFVAEHGVSPSRILHSGKLRAQQTAEVWSRFFPQARVEAQDGLNPNDDPGVWAERVREQQEDLVLVGHLPHLRRLAGLLLCGDPEREVVTFRTGGAVCLERQEQTERWSVCWALPPELVP